MATATDRGAARRFLGRIEWIDVENQRELVKHGVNTFLALSVRIRGRLAGIAEHVGANTAEVEQGWSPSTDGDRAYVGPGAAFAGGTRHVTSTTWREFGERERVGRLLRTVRASNAAHKQWAGGRSKRSSAAKTAGWTAT